jgi:hypothetical protein
VPGRTTVAMRSISVWADIGLPIQARTPSSRASRMTAGPVSALSMMMGQPVPDAGHRMEKLQARHRAHLKIADHEIDAYAYTKLQRRLTTIRLHDRPATVPLQRRPHHHRMTGSSSTHSTLRSDRSIMAWLRRLGSVDSGEECR